MWCTCMVRRKGFQFIFQLFLAFCWFKSLTSRTCRIHCLQKKRTVWQECKGNNPECLYVHPGLKDVARIEFITLWGKLNLQNFSNVKNVHVKYTHTGGDEWNGCDHVLIERPISVRVNGETCLSTMEQNTDSTTSSLTGNLNSSPTGQVTSSAKHPWVWKIRDPSTEHDGVTSSAEQLSNMEKTIDSTTSSLRGDLNSSPNGIVTCTTKPPRVLTAHASSTDHERVTSSSELATYDTDKETIITVSITVPTSIIIIILIMIYAACKRRARRRENETDLEIEDREMSEMTSFTLSPPSLSPAPLLSTQSSPAILEISDHEPVSHRTRSCRKALNF